MGTAVELNTNEPRLQALKPVVLTSERHVVTWTGLPGREVPAPEVQDHAWQLAQHLDKVTRLRDPLRIHLFADPEALGDGHAGDIGLTLRVPDGEAVFDADQVATADVLIGDGVAVKRHIATAVPWDELSGRLARLIKAYQVERCGRDTFVTWARGLSEGELRERLGFPKQESGSNGQ